MTHSGISCKFNGRDYGSENLTHPPTPKIDVKAGRGRAPARRTAGSTRLGSTRLPCHPTQTGERHKRLMVDFKSTAFGSRTNGQRTDNFFQLSKRLRFAVHQHAASIHYWVPLPLSPIGQSRPPPPLYSFHLPQSFPPPLRKSPSETMQNEEAG